MKKIIALIALVSCMMAQGTGKKVLTTDDFAGWKIIENSIISDDGKIVAYVVNPQKGDGELFLKNSDGKLIRSFERGYAPKISGDAKYVVFKIKQPAKTIRKAKLDKTPKKKMPVDSLGVYFVESNRLVKFAGLKNFKMADENSDWVAFLAKETVKKKKEKESAKEEKPEKPEKKKSEVKESKKEKSKNKKKKKEKKHGDKLLLFNLASGDTLKFESVTEYTVAKKGGAVAFVKHTEDSLFRSKVFVFNTETSKLDSILDKVGKAVKVQTDELGKQTAFLFSADTIKEKVYDLYLSEDNLTSKNIVNAKTKGMPEKWAPSEFASPKFSQNGSKLYFGTALAPVKEPKDTLLAEEKPKFDIWSWTDEAVIPEQRIKSGREKKRTYRAVYRIDNSKFVQLADETVRSVSLLQKGNGEIAFGDDGQPYKKASSWNARWHSDFYVVDLKTGKKTLMTEDKSDARISPEGKFVIWYDYKTKNYYGRSTKSNNTKVVSYTKDLNVKFYNERHDQPSDPYTFGIAGWTENDEFVYVYDRYDIWKIDPAGKKRAVNITNGFGRKNKIEFRYVRLDYEKNFISTDKDVLLRGFSEETKNREFYSVDFEKAENPKLLIGGNYAFSQGAKAKKADKFIWTKQNVKVFPDLWVSDLEFSNPVRLSDANPQQKDFNWATVEKIKWQSFTGETLEGLIYKPENFDPEKKYPVVVYFYELSTQGMHRHSIPSPSRSIINKTFYPSNGYVVFVPDITYKIGYPGQSAYNAIVSGTNYLTVKYPWVDSKRLALQGQSWGGYQTAYLVTQTDMFAAAMGGAVVSNMTSAYGGIRWGSGMARTFQYEHTQSRIGGTLWEKPGLYIENSPLFYVPKINTPLMLMHNDKDGAVPWYQGIEMFLAMRRLNKPVWMVNYNGEPHNLRRSSWANRMDLSIRMMQFFDHYLKDAPMPEWMAKGIPYTKKGKTKGYKLIK